MSTLVIKYLMEWDGASQAWALLEQEEGNIEEARQLFEAGSRADPHHLYIWQVCHLLRQHITTFCTHRVSYVFVRRHDA